MIYNLPPLPEPYHGFYATPMYSPEQMRAYAQAALDALADEAEASVKEMFDAGLGQAQPVAWQAQGGSIWNHKTCETDRPLYETPVAQPAASGEPVAWWIPKAEQFALAKKDGSRPFAKAWEPLYATAQPAPARVPLTDAQINEIAERAGHDRFTFAAAIEAAHGITPAKEAP